MSNVCDGKINTMSKTAPNTTVDSRSNQPFNRKRGAQLNIGGETTLGPITSTKGRRMNSHSTPSSNRREGDRDMLLDPALVSPIPMVPNNNETEHGEASDHSSLSSGNSIAPAGASTNISNDLRAVRIGAIGNRNNSSMELAIGFLLRMLQPGVAY